MLPTRLLDISLPQDSPIFLVYTRNLPVSSEVPLYATLSHCWGEKKPLRTLLSNVNSFHNGIPFGGLPRTFQDAISVARELGIAYIWIDSLCILQDDEDDWINEAAHMGSIYSSCFLNLVAADAPDGAAGCFFERDPTAKFQLPDTSNGNTYPCLPKTSEYLSHTSISKRGWCFQETLLAPRSLYFCKS